MSHPLFEIVTTTAGAVSIRHKLVNEIMHNPVGPWIESNALYIDQAQLSERLQRAPLDEPLIVFDIGLGAAANAIAALACYDRIQGPKRPLTLISFEREMELLRFTLEHADRFPHLCGYVDAMQTLLTQGRWQRSQEIDWQLREGDFINLIKKETLQPHVIFFDPYSPKVNQDMWGVAVFRDLRKLARPMDLGGTTLYTYSQATRIRVALIEAGFAVGTGIATGLKEETTVAASSKELLQSPLGERWYQRWQKSHQRHPFDATTPESKDASDAAVRSYFQIN